MSQVCESTCFRSHYRIQGYADIDMDRESYVLFAAPDLTAEEFYCIVEAVAAPSFSSMPWDDV